MYNISQTIYNMRHDKYKRKAYGMYVYKYQQPVTVNGVAWCEYTLRGVLHFPYLGTSTQIHQNKVIRGIRTSNKQNKMSLDADNVLLFLQHCQAIWIYEERKNIPLPLSSSMGGESESEYQWMFSVLLNDGGVQGVVGDQIRSYSM